MDIVLYNNASSNNTLNKDITELRTLKGVLRESSDLLNPVFNIQVDAFSDIDGANYCFAPELERYYFIDKFVLFRNNIFTLYASVDVLETYKNEILGLSGYVSQQAQNVNLYYDSGYQNEVKKEVELFESDITLPDTTSIILTTIGG